MALYETFAADVQDVNVYDIFGICWGLNGTESRTGMQLKNHDREYITREDGTVTSYKKYATAADYTPWHYHAARKNAVGELPPCTFGEPIIKYLNTDDVRTALHIPKEYPAWDMCTSDPYWNYTMQIEASQWIYERLQGKYRILKFSGDVDGAVPTDGTLAWINEINWDVVEDWRAYFVDDELAGFVTEYEGLTFGTVHGAGHMAPQFKPP